MGAVYLAEDLKHHRQVAIKVLRPDLAAGLGTDRFLREIEVAARLQHPAILPLHDSGEADGWVGGSSTSPWGIGRATCGWRKWERQCPKQAWSG
jgi:serine/threonine protein kinase